MDRGKVRRRVEKCKSRLISSTGPTLKQRRQAVQYTDRLYNKEKRDGTPNKPSPFSETGGGEGMN